MSATRVTLRLVNLDDVGSPVSDGDTLVFVASSGIWQPQAPTGVPSSRTIGTDSPLTGGGNLSADRTIALASQAANIVLAGPTSGPSVAPTFRALVAADIPDLSSTYVPTTRTVNGQALSSNVTVTTISGNAGTATALQTARAINGVSFDGTAAITVTAAADTLSGSTLASGVTASSLVSFGSSPTLTTPTIASFTNATHTHQNAAGGGTLDAAAVASGTLAAARIPLSLLTTDTDGATVTFTVSDHNRHIVTLGGSRTLAVTGDVDGQGFSVILLQGGAGSNTVTWWSGIKWQGGTVPTLSTAVGKYDVFSFIRLASGSYLGFATTGY